MADTVNTILDFTPHITTILSVAVAVWTIAWFLSSKINELGKTIFNKFEIHEQDDIRRFDSINNNIWELRITNALHGINGKTIERKTEERTFRRIPASEEGS